MTYITFTVYGDPVPQGSKSVTMRGGKPVMFDHASANLNAWRDAVRDAAAKAMFQGQFAPRQPVTVDLTFYLEKPKSNKQEMPAKKPDLDKLIRAMFDAFTTAQIWADDAQAVDVVARKRWKASYEQTRVVVIMNDAESGLEVD